MKTWAKISFSLLLILSGLPAAHGEPIGQPQNKFVSGQAADADEMNENFNELYQHLDAFEKVVQIDSQTKTVSLGNANTVLNTGHPVSFRGSPPMGTILATMGASFFDPKGQWVPCDGQVIDAPGSPYHTKKTPNLNGSQLFLRGVRPGTDQANSGVIKDDQMQTHTHQSVPHSHGLGLTNGVGSTKKASSTNPSGSFYVYGTTVLGSAKYGDPVAMDGEPAILQGNELRPKNMSITWIMKIRP